ncbi:sulfate ABC transporter permease subunit CysW [Phaeospirillum tilakii]|uniref:Sulfate ABC transporter permease subunit CysW n=1 Tax=Phaeospirillum tilakii TaxID=741673 RepID=A0ABW5CFP9_9PROT
MNAPPPFSPARSGGWGRRLLIGLAVLLALLVLVAPMGVIFVQAFAKGGAAWWAAITERETLHAIWLSLMTVALVVPLNMVYGLAAAWALSRFRFGGRKLLATLIELPFSVSPIVAGVACLMVYGATGLLGGVLERLDLKVMFALPGIVLATAFVTSPLIAREVLTLMQTRGAEEEEAALVLGAGGLRTFLSVTLPNVKWALFYGIVLCAARALGEFGAVSVVSGQIRGETNTLPLQIDLLYHDYDGSAAFAAASVLTVLALITVLLKLLIEGRESRT